VRSPWRTSGVPPAYESHTPRVAEAPRVSFIRLWYKWFNPEKGFGFIQPQDGSKDVFVHITALQAAGISTLNDGQKMNYDVVTERGKQAAANLKLG
jgi:CspA family cold shock protein